MFLKILNLCIHVTAFRLLGKLSLLVKGEILFHYGINRSLCSVSNSFPKNDPSEVQKGTKRWLDFINLCHFSLHTVFNKKKIPHENSVCPTGLVP